MTWTVAVLVCFLSLPNDAPDLCMPAAIPLKFETKEQCMIAKQSFVNYFHPIAVERQLNMGFKCAFGDTSTILLQEIIHDGHITGRSQRLSSS